ncbi:MAG: DUF115 domain-containing protein [Eubacterium sp.]|nr:DUF115 domain-containing protein [Eubacterium sp.]
MGELYNFIENARRWIFAIRRQDISLSDNLFTQGVEFLSQLLARPDMGEVQDQILDAYGLVLQAMEDKDYILAADYMEMSLLPVVQHKILQDIDGFPELEEEENYRVEYTGDLFPTLCKRGIYLHSNNDPITEALAWGEKVFTTGVESYSIVGLAMGYQAYILGQKDLIQVKIYEEDQRVIELFDKYSPVAKALRQNPRVEIIHDPGYRRFVEAGDKQGKIALYHPSLQTIREDKLGNQMANLFMQMDNMVRWENNFLLNFAWNSKQVLAGIEDLRAKFQDKDVYLIAGGPSLDRNIGKLKDKQGDNSLILTVGTSLRRCLSEGIQPDFAIITDPKAGVVNQIRDLAHMETPLIILSTTYSQVEKNYRGPKYLLCQEGFDLAENLAKERGWELVETGGSVTTTALDLCIRLGASRVIFLGLDLAFTGGKTHAGQTGSQTNRELGLQVEDVYGNMVGTSKNLNTYRLWIERRIQKALDDKSRTVFIDASEGGARVKGTLVSDLDQV